MKIEHRQGDVITFIKNNPNKHLIFAHGCNCLNKMGSGIAKSVKRRLPFLFELDTAVHQAELQKDGIAYPLVGTIASVQGSGGNYYQNWYTQLNITTDRATLQRIESCINSFNGWLDEMNLNLDEVTLCIPKIGCGLGGLNWEDVEPLFEKVKCKVIVFSL